MQEFKNKLFFVLVLDKKIPVQITLLGYLIPPKGRISRKIKFSSTEVIESLIVRTDVSFGSRCLSQLNLKLPNLTGISQLKKFFISEN